MRDVKLHRISGIAGWKSCAVAAAAAAASLLVTAPAAADPTDICKMGFDFTESASDLSGDDSFTTVSQVVMNKPCAGTVLGLFSSEIGAAGDGDVQMIVEARCLATGGFANPCTVGSTVLGFPGAGDFVLLQTNALVTQAHAMNVIWPNLKRGKWRFRVNLSGGDVPGSIVGWRSFIVQAFEGGGAL